MSGLSGALAPAGIGIKPDGEGIKVKGVEGLSVGMVGGGKVVLGEGGAPAVVVPGPGGTTQVLGGIGVLLEVCVPVSRAARVSRASTYACASEPSLPVNRLR